MGFNLQDRNFLNYYWKENARPIRIEPRPGIDLSFANKRITAMSRSLFLGFYNKYFVIHKIIGLEISCLFLANNRFILYAIKDWCHFWI